MQIRGRMVGKRSGAEQLGMTVYKLAPGASGFNLHAHYGMEELFVVLSGRPTLRDGTTSRSSRQATSLVPAGARGLHTFANRTDEPARLLAVSNKVEPEVVLYPEIGKVGRRDALAFVKPPRATTRGSSGCSTSRNPS